jgi:hypothetical protein
MADEVGVVDEGMMVFLSWSGEESRALAETLHGWLPSVLDFAHPWMSSEDITKGRRWNAEIGQTLEDTSYCIVCVTPGVQYKPWVNFEAGAISKIVQDAYVSPLLLGVSPEELNGLPLSTFQCTRFNKKEIKKLLLSVNNACVSRVPESRINARLDYTWATLCDQVKQIDLSNGNNGDTDNSEQDANNEPLANTEIAILVTLATAGIGKSLIAEEIANVLNENVVRTQYHIDRLKKWDMIGDILAVNRPRRYYLRETGRAYLVENNLV